MLRQIMLRQALFVAFAASIALAGITPVAAAPESWVQHRDPQGFLLSCPQGWSVSVSKEGAITARSKDGTERVVASPFFLKQPQGSGAWLRGVPQRFAALFPDGRIEKLQQRSSRPDEAVASLTYQLHGRACRANLLCSIFERSGMFYAIGAPGTAFARKKAEMVEVLRTLHFTQPTVATSGREASPQVRLQYVRWRDPQEGAFTAEIPQGWQAQGGLIRRNALDPRQTADVLAPDGSVLLRVGDAAIPGFILPSAALAATGFVEGSTYTTGPVSYIVARFRTGTEFAQWYLKQRVSAPYSGLRLLQAKDRPDIARPLQSLYNRQGGGLLQYRVSVGEVPFTCERDGKTMHGLCYGLTILMSSGGFNIWGGYPVGYVAAEGKESVAFAALRHLVGTWQTDPSWMASQSETALRVSRITAETNAHISKTISDAFWSRRSVLDDTSRKWSNAMLGVTDIRDPETGETWKVAAGHNYYWAKGGTVVGTDTFTRPDIDFTPLTEW